jgi:hypothetical protein
MGSEHAHTCPELGTLVSFDEYGHEHNHEGSHPCYHLFIHQHFTKGTKMQDHKREKPKTNQKRLLGFYKLPSKSEWNESMTEGEKRDYIESLIKNMAEKLEENPNE